MREQRGHVKEALAGNSSMFRAAKRPHSVAARTRRPYLGAQRDRSTATATGLPQSVTYCSLDKRADRGLPFTVWSSLERDRISVKRLSGKSRDKTESAIG